MSLLDLASAWVQSKTAHHELKAQRHQRLQEQLETPNSLIESIWEDQDDRFQNLRAVREQLREYHKIRVSGGIIATLLEIRALMVFGVGGVFTAEQDNVSDWLNTQLDDIDTLLYDIGTDAYFYGYSLAEIRETVGGDFAELTLIQPWTTVPRLDRSGTVDRWEQEIKTKAGRTENTFRPDDVLHFRVMKSSGRDPVGMSLLGRAMEEAESFRDNQRSIKNAIQLQGFPKYHVKVGREDGAPPDDNELRRLRPQFDNVHELTKWITGRDVEIKTVGAEGFEFEGITTHDLSKLALAFMLPIELTQITGGDGLGTGFPARVRERMFLLSAQAHQSLMARQLVEQVAKPLLVEYGPVSEEQVDDLDLGFSFEDPIVDVEKTATKLSAVGDDMRVNERRDMLDLEPLEGSEGEQYIAPAEEERNESQPDSSGLFQDSETLAALQRAGISARVLETIADYTTRQGTTSNAVQDLEQWVEEFADQPSQALEPYKVALSLFAADQGVTVDEAREQPVENLVRWLERNRNLQSSGAQASELAETDWWDEHLEALQERTWRSDDKQLFGFTEGTVPQFVKDQLLSAVLEGSPIFSDIKSIPDSELMEFRLFMADQLTSDGWTITDMRDEIVDQFGVDEHRAETMARSTTQNMVNEARETGYRERDNFDDLRFDWSGMSFDPNRSSDVCQAIKDEIPDEGMHLDELKQLVHEKSKEHGHEPKGWSPHPNCTHSHVRVV